MDIQIVLIFILAMLTVTLVGVGLYLILVLKDFRQTVLKANDILDDVERVSNALTNPMSIITSAIEGFKAIRKLKKEE